MGQVYLIRYGLARSLGRFEATSDTLERGQSVVIRTHRGTELGEVLSPTSPDPQSSNQLAPILRVANLQDLERARAVRLDRATCYELCRAVLEGGIWPLELVDAEPLLDENRVVIQYLGPHSLDHAGLVAAFRDRCGLQVVLEPVGRDLADTEPEPAEEAHGCGSCGSSGGGCGSGSGGCGPGSGGCAVKSLVTARRRVPIDA